MVTSSTAVTIDNNRTESTANIITSGVSSQTMKINLLIAAMLTVALVLMLFALP